MFRIYDLQVQDDDDWPMVEKKGNQFVVNGQPFYVNGFNTYWLMVFAADQSTRGKISEVFQQASSVGLTVCRTWAFNDGQWRALQKSPSVYDEEVFKVLLFLSSHACDLYYIVLNLTVKEVTFFLKVGFEFFYALLLRVNKGSICYSS